MLPRYIGEWHIEHFIIIGFSLVRSEDSIVSRNNYARARMPGELCHFAGFGTKTNFSNIIHI